MSKRNNPNQKGKKRKGVTFASSVTGASEGPSSEFDFFDTPEDTASTDEPVSSRFPTTHEKLEIHRALPSALVTWMKRKKRKSVQFIKYKVTPDIQGEALCDRLERWYGKHIIVLHKKTGAEQVAFEEYHRQDPLGLIPIPKTDTKCWELRLSAQTITIAPTATATEGDQTGAPSIRSSPPHTRSRTQTDDEEEEAAEDLPDDADLDLAGEVAPAPAMIPAAAIPQQVQTYVKTKFMVELQFMQSRTYMYLRSSIVLFMDKTCGNTLKVWIEKTERDMGDELVDENRLRIGTRIPWADIRTYIVEKFCVPTLGSFHFLPLFKMKRKDGQLFHLWCHAIDAIKKKVVRHGNGWEMIIDKECMNILKV